LRRARLVVEHRRGRHRFYHLNAEPLKAVLAAEGMTMKNVVSVSVFLKDLNELPKMNAVYATYFREPMPARTTVQVAALPRDAKIEISLVATHTVSPSRHEGFQPPLPPR
jgi:hypothetical protein